MSQLEGASVNSEQLPDGGDSDHGIDAEHGFSIESDIGDDNETMLHIESNVVGNEEGHMLGIDRHVPEDTEEQIFVFDSNDCMNDGDDMLETQNDNGNHDTSILDDQIVISSEKDYPPPVIGMEFDSYDDAYNYYNCYAKGVGFAIRVKSSWTKRNSKEKRGAVLCCNCEGFKMMKEASTRRKETRTGCLAMIRLRLVDCCRWRVDEVKLEHNHLFDPDRAQNSKSHKKMDCGVKRKLGPTVDVEVQTIKLYRTLAVDAVGYGSSNEGEFGNHFNHSTRLLLKNGEVQAIYDYFCRVQLTNPNFFYIMDLNDEGYLRNVFWIDSRSRAAYVYFGDVIAIDNSCLNEQYNIPLLTFVGVNHHGQSILLGCGLLADETMEGYIWLLRAWLTCMKGRPPQTIITDQSKALQGAIAEVFPRAHHRLCLHLVMESIVDKLGEMRDLEIFKTALHRTTCNFMKIEEFEIAWEDMVQHFGVKELEWLQRLYDDRERWVPAYLKDTSFAGMFASYPDESFRPFFHEYVHKHTSLKEFFDIYEQVLQKRHMKEAFDDFESNEWNPVLKTGCSFELQLCEVYTKEIFLKFQHEVETMSNCCSATQVHATAAIVTYMIKESDAEGATKNTKNFEVMYDKVGAEVRCICGCFNFKGYPCRHALFILNYNNVEEIPSQYILSRWRKDFKRVYVPDVGFNNIDVANQDQLFNHLYRRALQVVEVGMTSQDHYMVAWQAFKESLNKVRLVANKHAQSD